jgi:hypothetical protein
MAGTARGMTTTQQAGAPCCGRTVQRPDGHRRRTQGRPAGRTALATALLPGLLAGCTSLGLGNDRAAVLSNPPRLHDPAAAEKASKEAAERQITAYYDALKAAEDSYGKAKTVPMAGTPADPTVVRYVDEGLALVDSHCLRWFQHLEDFERRTDAKKKDFNVISALGTALIGVAKLHSDVTTVYGAGTTAYMGWSDNLAQAFVIAPSSRGVKTKVMAVMQERRKSVEDRRDTLNFPAARRELEAYADLCTYTSAKDLVDVSVAAADPAVERSGQFIVRPRQAFAPDANSSVLRRLWKPDGHTIDKSVDAKLKAWLDRQGISPSITLFLNGEQFAPLRQRALQDIDFD